MLLNCQRDAYARLTYFCTSIPDKVLPVFYADFILLSVIYAQ